MKDCEECVYYHLERCDEERVDRNQVLEALQIALVEGGSVTIPLLHRAVSFMEELRPLASGKREAGTGVGVDKQLTTPGRPEERAISR